MLKGVAKLPRITVQIKVSENSSPFNKANHHYCWRKTGPSLVHKSRPNYPHFKRLGDLCLLQKRSQTVKGEIKKNNPKEIQMRKWAFFGMTWLLLIGPRLGLTSKGAVGKTSNLPSYHLPLHRPCLSNSCLSPQVQSHPRMHCDGPASL